MEHMTDACRIEKIRDDKDSKYYLGTLNDDDELGGTLNDKPSYDESDVPPDTPAPSPSYDESAIPPGPGTAAKDSNLFGAYREVTLEKHFAILPLLKHFDKLGLENILSVGKLIEPLKSSKIRSTKVCLSSKEGIDEKLIFPDENHVGFRLRNLCKYINDNPDNFDRVELASAFAYGFCMVHPFTDGNGRTSRLLANHFLRSNESFMQLPTDRKDYRVACFQINLTGDLDPMYEFFYKRLCQNIDMSILN